MLTDALTLRRSIYALGQDMPISDEKLIKTVEQCMEHCPTAFNAQSSRVAILLAAKHTQFWKLVADALKKVTPSEKQAAALQRVADFAAAHGTILLFEDADTFSGWNIPIFGVGGIKDYKDVLEFMYAGASLLQIGTSIMYSGPEIFQTISDDLSNFLEENGYKNVTEIIGLSHEL